MKKFKSKTGVWLTLALLLVCTAAVIGVLAGVLFYSGSDSDLVIDLVPDREEDAFRTMKLAAQAEETPAARTLAANAETPAQAEALSGDFIVEDEWGTVWLTDTEVDIFKVSYENEEQNVTVAGKGGDKVIAPGTENTYTFTLRNNGETDVDYKMTVDAFFTGLPDGKVIPVEVRLGSLNGWLVGGETWRDPVLALNGVEDFAVLGPGKSAVYTLEWCWPYESGDDEWDTWLGNHAEDLTLTIRINTEASFHDPETPPIVEPVPDVFHDDHIAYIYGYPDGTVRPEADITRAEVAAIFYRLLKIEVQEVYETTEHPYPDIPETAWYRKEAATMTAMGFMEGYPDGTFRGDDTITRAELAAVLSRLSRTEYDDSTESSFTDIEGHWAEKAITHIEQFNWIVGYEDGTFRPDEPITRAEVVTMINRVLHRLPEQLSDLHPDMHIWPDNADTEAWYYIAMQEATHTHTYIRLRGTREKWTAILSAPPDTINSIT